jgi:hypothetical protein
MSEDVVSQTEFEAGLVESLGRYEKYRRILFSQNPSKWKMASFGWRPLKGQLDPGSRRSLDIAAMYFDQMSGDFARESANYINKLVVSTNRLKAWAELLEEVEDKGEKFDILAEFVDPLTHFGLGLPYAIKQKFIFAFSHLSHQIRLLESPSKVDDLPGDGKINEKTSKRFAGDSAAGDQLLDAISRIASENFSESTGDFRHGFNHRITPGVEMGITNSVNRVVVTEGTGDPFENEMKSIGLKPLKLGEKRVIYGIGGSNPIPLRQVISALKEQIDVIHACFECYKIFVIDHETWVIGKYGSIVQEASD